MASLINNLMSLDLGNECDRWAKSVIFPLWSGKPYIFYQDCRFSTKWFSTMSSSWTAGLEINGL